MTLARSSRGYSARTVIAFLCTTGLCASLARSSHAIPPTPPAPSGSGKAASSDEKKQASERFKKGVELHKAGNYDAALIEFERAYELAPNYRVLYNMAVSYRELRDSASALSAFERYLAEGASEIDAKRRTEVETEVARLRDLVALVTVNVNIVGAEISVDDVAIGKAPLSKPVMVNPGRRKFSATKEGLVAAARVVNIATKDRTTVELSLTDPRAAQPVPTDTAPPPPPPPVTAPPPPTSAPPPLVSAAPPPPEPSKQRTLGYVAGGVGVIGVVGGSVLGLVASSKWSKAKDHCPGNVCDSRASQNDASDAKTLANASTVFFALGAVGLIGGAALILTAPSDADGPVSSVRITPGVGIGSGFVSATGRFLPVTSRA